MAEHLWGRCVRCRSLPPSSKHQATLFLIFFPLHSSPSLWASLSCQICLSIFQFSVYFCSPLAVISHHEPWLHKLVFTDTHAQYSQCSLLTNRVCWWNDLRRQSTCLRRQTLPAELWSSTADSIIHSQVPLSGSMGPGDIIVTPLSPLPLLSLMEARSWWRGLVNNLGALVHFITWPARLAGTFTLSALV